MEEIWKTIPEIEGIGEISSSGLFKYYNWHNTGKEVITKGNLQKSGHYYAGFRKDGKPQNQPIHRLVALAFIPIPERLKHIPAEKLDVHHIDGNPANNSVSNLMWVTRKEHNDLHKTKEIEMLSMDWQHEAFFKSVKEAVEKTGAWQGNISSCISGKLKSTGGHRWRYKEPEPTE